jgi:hypothetical protein
MCKPRVSGLILEFGNWDAERERERVSEQASKQASKQAREKERAREQESACHMLHATCYRVVCNTPLSRESEGMSR